METGGGGGEEGPSCSPLTKASGDAEMEEEGKGGESLVGAASSQKPFSPQSPRRGGGGGRVDELGDKRGEGEQAGDAIQQSITQRQSSPKRKRSCRGDSGRGRGNDNGEDDIIVLSEGDDDGGGGGMNTSAAPSKGHQRQKVPHSRQPRPPLLREASLPAGPHQQQGSHRPRRPSPEFVVFQLPPDQQRQWQSPVLLPRELGVSPEQALSRTASARHHQQRRRQRMAVLDSAKSFDLGRGGGDGVGGATLAPVPTAAILMPEPTAAASAAVIRPVRLMRPSDLKKFASFDVTGDGDATAANDPHRFVHAVSVDPDAPAEVVAAAASVVRSRSNSRSASPRSATPTPLLSPKHPFPPASSASASRRASQASVVLNYRKSSLSPCADHHAVVYKRCRSNSSVGVFQEKTGGKLRTVSPTKANEEGQSSSGNNTANSSQCQQSTKSTQAAPRTVRFDKRRPQTLELECPPSSSATPDSAAAAGGGGAGGGGDPWRKRWRRGRRKRKRRRRIRRLTRQCGADDGEEDDDEDGDDDIDVEGMVDVYLTTEEELKLRRASVVIGVVATLIFICCAAMVAVALFLTPEMDKLAADHQSTQKVILLLLRFQRWQQQQGGGDDGGALAPTTEGPLDAATPSGEDSR